LSTLLTSHEVLTSSGKKIHWIETFERPRRTTLLSSVPQLLAEPAMAPVPKPTARDAITTAAREAATGNGDEEAFISYLGDSDVLVKLPLIFLYMNSLPRACVCGN
jgi:hypothetical protein